MQQQTSRAVAADYASSLALLDRNRGALLVPGGAVEIDEVPRPPREVRWIPASRYPLCDTHALNFQVRMERYLSWREHGSCELGCFRHIGREMLNGQGVGLTCCTTLLRRLPLADCIPLKSSIGYKR